MKSRIIFGVWVFLTSTFISVAMSRHIAPFVYPKNLESTAKTIAAHNTQVGSNQIISIHILDPRCSCSQRVLQYLKNGSYPLVQHIVYLLSPPDSQLQEALRNSKVKVIQSTPAEAKAQFGLETVPWLVILDQKMNVLYSGGYSRTQIRTASDLQIEEIIDKARNGKTHEPLPSFGCVTSKKLRQMLLLLD